MTANGSGGLLVLRLHDVAMRGSRIFTQGLERARLDRAESGLNREGDQDEHGQAGERSARNLVLGWGAVEGHSEKR